MISAAMTVAQLLALRYRDYYVVFEYRRGNAVGYSTQNSKGYKKTMEDESYDERMLGIAHPDGTLDMRCFTIQATINEWHDNVGCRMGCGGTDADTQRTYDGTSKAVWAAADATGIWDHYRDPKEGPIEQVLDELLATALKAGSCGCDSCPSGN